MRWWREGGQQNILLHRNLHKYAVYIELSYIELVKIAALISWHRIRRHTVLRAWVSSLV
jgi:hypothetical protein